MDGNATYRPLPAEHRDYFRGTRDSPTNAQPEQVMHRRTKGQLVRKTWDRIDDHRAYFFSLAGAAVNRTGYGAAPSHSGEGCMATNLAAVIETPVPRQATLWDSGEASTAVCERSRGADR